MKIKINDIGENLAILFDIVGEDKFLEIARMYGGDNLYIPTYSSVTRNSRNRDILKRYNGVNAVNLAREYGISVNQVRKIVNEDDA